MEYDEIKESFTAEYIKAGAPDWESGRAIFEEKPQEKIDPKPINE